MSDDQWIREMAERARADAPPAMDVTAAVLWEIRGRRPEAYDPMPIIAGSAAAAACIIVAYAAQTWQSLQDPFASLLASVNVVLQ